MRGKERHDQEEGTGLFTVAQKAQGFMDSPVCGMKVFLKMPWPGSPVIVHHTSAIDSLPIFRAALLDTPFQRYVVGQGDQAVAGGA